MKIASVTSRVNVSTYYPLFERLNLDMFASDPQNARVIRRSGTVAYTKNPQHMIERLERTMSKDPRYPEPHIEKDHLDRVADVFGDICVGHPGTFWIEAQRIQCHYYDTGVMDLRGAVGMLCMNRYNMEGGFVGPARVMPGCLYFSEDSEENRLVMTSVRVSDLAYDITGYVDCFLLHTI